MRFAPASSTPNSRCRNALIWPCIAGKIRAVASCSVLSRSKIHTRREGAKRATRIPILVRRPLLALDQRSYALIGEHLEQQRVGHAPVDDMHALHAVARGVERRADLGQHAARDDA